MRIREVFAHFDARGVSRGCSVVFGRFDWDFYAFRRFRKFSLVPNGFRKFSAVLIRCRTFSCGFRRFPKIAQRRRRQRLTGKSGGARARPGASGRVRACPGAAGVRACPGDKKTMLELPHGYPGGSLQRRPVRARPGVFRGSPAESARRGRAPPPRVEFHEARQKTKKQSRNVEFH